MIIDIKWVNFGSTFKLQFNVLYAAANSKKAIASID